MKHLPFAAALLTAVAISMWACGDQLISPEADDDLMLEGSAADLANARAELLLTTQALHASGPDAGRVTRALTSLTRSLERPGGQAAQRDFAAARAALQRYRDAPATGSAADPEIEALSLVLDHMAAPTGTNRSQER